MAVTLGFIGVGGLGHLQLTTCAAFDGIDIAGAADVSAEAMAVFETEFDAPGYEDHRRLLDEHADALDAVVIVTPHTLHYEQAKAALDHGLHVLVEKPMVTDIGHAVDLVETADERGLVLQVGYQRHFHPGFAEMRRLLGSGRIGELHAVNCYLGQDWIDPHRDTWRADPALAGGGQLYDTGSHLLDACLWTTDTTPTSVTGTMDFDAPGVDVNSALAMELDRDGAAVVGSVGLSGDGYAIDPTEGYVCWGTDGRLTYAENRIAVAEKGAMTYSTEITTGTEFQTLNRQKLENFVDSVRGTAEPAVPGAYGLQVTALTEAAYLAAERGCAVEIGPLIEAARRDRDAAAGESAA